MLPVLITDSVTPNLSRAIHYALLWGMEGVVLRTVGTSGNRVPFVNEPQLRFRLSEAELPIVGVDPGLFEGTVRERAVWLNDQMLLSDVAAFCNRVGCNTIITGAVAGVGEDYDLREAANILARAGAISLEYGISLAVRNDCLSECSSGESLAQLITAADHPAVMAAWSPADALQMGHNPASGLEALIEAGEISLVTVRDGEAIGSDWTDKTPGDGAVGWMQQLELLANGGFAGPICVDVRGEAPAKLGLSHASAVLQQIRLARSNVGQGG